MLDYLSNGHQTRPLRLIRQKPCFAVRWGCSGQRALRLGIHPRTLYACATSSRQLQPRAVPTRRTPAAPVLLILWQSLGRSPGGDLPHLCLAFHNLTTQILRCLHRFRRGAEPPRLDYPPVRIFWFTGEAFTEALKPTRWIMFGACLYPEKTLATVSNIVQARPRMSRVEALKHYRQRQRMRLDELLRAARICRWRRSCDPTWRPTVTGIQAGISRPAR